MGIKYIKAKDIERWADGMSSQSELPLLIRWLISRTVDEKYIDEIEFRAYDSVQGQGADGRLNCKIKTIHIPKGYSIWELTNQGGILTYKNGKADKDFKARTDKNVGYQPNKSTFVFVTGRKCDSKHDWKDSTKKQNKKRINKKKIWKNIRFYDANDLEQWLESDLIVSWKIATNILKIYNPSIESLERYGKIWSDIKQCKITCDIVLTDRKAASDAIKHFLEGEPKKINITASNIDEAIAFIWAVIKDIDEKKQELLFSRTFIIEEHNDIKTISESKNHHVIIYTGKDSIFTDYAAKMHHVIIPISGVRNENNNISNDIILPPISKESFKNVFSKDFNQWEDLFIRCNGNLNDLRKILNQ